MFTLEQQVSGGICRIAVSGEITIYSAVELKSKLLEAVAGSEVVECDLADISDFDSAGVQLLEMLRRQVDTAGSMRVTGASEPVRELLDLYRLSGQLLDLRPRASDSGEAS
jgi:anti-sigma B factor antagonist